MSNYSYLCATSMETTYPCFNDPEYDAEQQTICCDVSCIPLMWMGLFRPSDIVTKTFTADGEEIYTEAPLTRRTTAIEQLRSATPVLNQLFAEQGSINDYAGYLIEAIAAVDHEYLTIEMEEIAALTEDEREFYDEFRVALGSLDNPDKHAGNRLAMFAQLRPGKFPPARMMVDNIAPKNDDDIWNFCRLIGAGQLEAGIGREVPWEV